MIDSEIANEVGESPWNMVAELPNGPAPSSMGGPIGNMPGRAESEIASNRQDSPSSSTNGMPTTSQDIRNLQQASRDGLLEAQGALAGNALNANQDSWRDPVSGESSPLGSEGSYPANSTSGSQTSNSRPANLAAQQAQATNSQSGPSSQSSPSNSISSQGGSPSFSTQVNQSNPESAQGASPSSEQNPAEQSPNVDISPRRPSRRSSNDSKKVASAPVRTWTTSHRHVNGTMVTRPMTIVAMSDRWLIMRDNAPHQVERVIPLEVGPSAAGQQLETAINERVESWGIAVSNGYWQPKLTLQFAPDAEVSVQRLRKILDGSGLDADLQPLR
jgi:hypothetical protein